MNKDQVRSRIFELRERTRKIKQDPSLRHIPNDHDLKVAFNHASMMKDYQYDSIIKTR